jgi:hypothetical protein
VGYYLAQERLVAAAVLFDWDALVRKHDVVWTKVPH